MDDKKMSPLTRLSAFRVRLRVRGKISARIWPGTVRNRKMANQNSQTPHPRKTRASSSSLSSHVARRRFNQPATATRKLIPSRGDRSSRETPRIRHRCNRTAPESNDVRRTIGTALAENLISTWALKSCSACPCNSFADSIHGKMDSC